MRKMLIASAATVALAMTMAVPAGASVNVAAPARGGSYGGGRPGGGDHRGGGDQSHSGWRGDRRDRDGHYDHDRDGHDDYYYGPYYDGPGACPDDGYYDANGTYWYWDPATNSYVAC